MVDRGIAVQPFHELLGALEDWRVDPVDAHVQAIAAALSRLLQEYDVDGVGITMDAQPLKPLAVASGSLAALDEGTSVNHRVESRSISLDGGPDNTATLSIDGSGSGYETMAEGLGLVLSAVWSRESARFQGQQLAALDTAVRGLAGVQSIDRVLQLIVDQVRGLVGAQYAALGIVGPFGSIEQFITSGLKPGERERIGPLPRGHGMLGLIIDEDRSLLIEDIAADPRRYGFPPNHPEMHSFLGTPVRSKGQTIGNLYLTNKTSAPMFSDADLQLLEKFALHAGIAMDNARLQDENQRLAIVDERQRISQDLHDSIIQSLYAISLSLEDLPEISAEDPAEGVARTDRAIDSIHGAIRDIRNFIFGLQPELLDHADLSSGVRTLAVEFQANTLIDLEVKIDDELPTVSGEDSAHLLAITREGLSNIARHSHATRASLELRSEGGMLRLIVSDNGSGFDPTQPRSSGQHGVSNLRSRAEAAGGTLNLASEPGAGTRVVAEIPVRGEE